MPRPIPYGRRRAQARTAAHPLAEQTAEFYRQVAEHRAQQFTSHPEDDGPRGLAGGYRQPGDMAEFCLMLPEHGWDWTLGSFLDHFRFHPNRAALDIPPSDMVQGYFRAFLAATVATIANERGWTAPAWTEEASTFLPGAGREDRGQGPVEFRRRGIIVGANVLTRF